MSETVTAPDILNEIKAGRLVVVPREAEQRMLEAAGRYADGCAIHNYGAPPDADGTWDAMLAASPDHTTGLVALVEGMERERDKAQRLVNQLSDDITFLRKRRGDLVRARDAAEARALAAEAKVEALREALAPFGSGAVVFYENEPDDCVLSLGRWKYQEDGRARFYADVQFTVADVRRARALTQEQLNAGE